MSNILLPKGFCQELNSILRKLWWGFQQENKHNLMFLAGDNICKPKALGGVGIKSMEFMNKAFLARLGWKLASDQPSLWVDVLQSKYFKHGVSFLNPGSNPSSSWLWKGLLYIREVVQQGACLVLSNGINANIWNSPWIPTMPHFKPVPNQNLVELPDFQVVIYSTHLKELGTPYYSRVFLSPIQY